MPVYRDGNSMHIVDIGSRKCLGKSKHELMRKHDKLKYEGDQLKEYKNNLIKELALIKGVPLTQIITKDPETTTPRNASADPNAEAKLTIRNRPVTTLDHHDTFSPTNDMHGGERKNEECNL